MRSGGITAAKARPVAVPKADMTVPARMATCKGWRASIIRTTVGPKFAAATAATTSCWPSVASAAGSARHAVPGACRRPRPTWWSTSSAHVPVRQWVLSLPIPLRLLLAAQPELVTPVLQVVQRVVTRHLLDTASLRAGVGHGGAVTLIQRFGSAANLNIHLHCLVLDGVYLSGADGVPTFVEAGAPSDDELHALLHTVITRLMKMLTRHGVLIEEMGQTYLADPNADGDEARTLRALQAAAITYRIAFGPRAGQKVLTLRGAMAREGMARELLCSDIDGFSLHAAVRIEAHDRKRLEQLCRYITRPALADERVQLNAAGQVELKLKTPWRDGTTHLVMSPLEFMQRLAALVPRPRLHLIRFHGVLAPNAKLRSLVVPQGSPKDEQAPGVAASGIQCEAQTAQVGPERISWARLLKRVFDNPLFGALTNRRTRPSGSFR